MIPLLQLPVIGTIDIPSDFPTDANSLIGAAVPVVIALGGLVFFAMLLLGGFRYLTAGGDEKAAQEARKTLTNAFVGLIVIVAAFLISQLLFAVFGIDSFVKIV
jgi:hypothetical protein